MKTKVLVVEDTQIHIDAAREQFANSDKYELVGVATNFREAIDMLRETNPEIVMTDIMIPFMASSSGTEPLGLSVALAAVEAGCQKVFFVSDMDRHKSDVASSLCSVNGDNKKIIFPYERVQNAVYRTCKKNWYALLDGKIHEECSGLVRA